MFLSVVVYEAVVLPNMAIARKPTKLLRTGFMLPNGDVEDYYVIRTM